MADPLFPDYTEIDTLRARVAELENDKARLIEKNSGANAVTAQWIGKYDHVTTLAGALRARVKELEVKLKVAEEALADPSLYCSGEFCPESGDKFCCRAKQKAALAKIKEAS